MTRICAVIALFLAVGFKGFCQEPNPPEAKDPRKMEIGVWRVPPGFIPGTDPSDKNGFRKPLRGFKSKHNQEAVQYDATEFLKSMGIAFPPGSEALYNQSLRCLIVRNTPENLDLIDAMGCEGDRAAGPTNVAIEISAFECVIPSEGNAASANWPTYSDIKGLPTKCVKLLDRVSAVTRSGQRIAISHVINPASSKASGDNTPKDPEQAAADQTLFQNGESGTKAEVETVVGPDNNTIDTNISYRFRKQSAGNAASEINFVTSFVSWDDYPTVLHVSPVQNQEGKFLVVVGNIRLVNPGGWNLKALRDEAAKAATGKK